MAKAPATQETCLWERQEGESGKAWEAFLLYRNMGPSRTVSAVVKKCEKSRTLIDRWKDRWFWEERVRAYDNEVQKDALRQAKADTREMFKRQAQIGMRLQKFAMDALEKADLESASLKDIRELAKIGAELERMSRRGTVGEYEEAEKQEAQFEDDVTVYAPDNGKQVEGDDESD